MQKNMLIGDKAFYKKLFGIAVPMMIQMGITNFAGMLDNVMVGRVGTDEMTGVAIANQLIFVFNLIIFGAVSGPGIFTAQYVGQGNDDGVRHTMRIKLYFCFVVTMICMLVFGTSGNSLIHLYLNNSSDVSSAANTLKYGHQYLMILMISFIPFAATQVYAGTLKEAGETVLPMKAGIAAVVTNTLLNYMLIYGKFGAPKLGIEGAAIATVTSRLVELLIVVIWAHTHTGKYRFFKGLYRSFKVPGHLTKEVFIKGLPLLLNEGLWGSGIAMLMQCYSVRGLEVVSALNISNTLNNIFNVVYLSIGNSVGILVGHLLGMGKMKEAKQCAYRIIACATALCLVMALLLAGTSFVFPQLYNTTDDIRKLAGIFLIVIAVYMPAQGFLHSTYFTIRTGGKTIITFFFDCGFMWIVTIPMAYVLSRFTSIPIVPLYFICTGADVIKSIVGFILLKKGIWLNNLVGEK